MIVMRLVPESVARHREDGGLDASVARKNSKSNLGGVRGYQGWRSRRALPPISVARVRFPDSASYVG